MWECEEEEEGSEIRAWSWCEERGSVRKKKREGRGLKKMEPGETTSKSQFCDIL